MESAADPEEPPDWKPACVGHDRLFAGVVGKRQLVMEVRSCGEHLAARYYTDADPHSRLLYAPAGDHRKFLGLGRGEHAFEPSDIEITSAESDFQDGGFGRWREGKRIFKWRLSRVAGLETYDSLRQERGRIEHSVDRSFSYQRVSSFQESVVCGASPGRKPPIPAEAFPGGAVDRRDGECHSGDFREVSYSSVEILEARPKLLVQRSNLALHRFLAGTIPEPEWVDGGEVQLTPIYARGRVFSLMYKTSGVGIGAYPAHDQYGLVLDLRSGEFVELEELMRVYSKPDLDFEAKEQAERDFNAMLDRRLPLRPWGKGPGEGCSWFESLPSPHFTRNGLSLTPNLPHVNKVCQYENLGTPVPREIAKRYAKPGSLLADVLAGNWGP